MRIVLSLASALFFLSFSNMTCKKNNIEPKKELPAETQIGRHSFGCLVDGKVWLPESKYPYSALSALTTNKRIDIRASNASSSESVVITIYDLKSTGDYALDSVQAEASFGNYVYRHYSYEGIVSITKFDEAKEIVAGRFWFKAKGSKSDSVSISDGRFDIILN
jgi:hypothetical protein